MSEVKETKEAMIGALLLGSFLYGKFRDGVQMADFQEIMEKLSKDEEFKAKIEAAYKDAEKMNAEFAALDIKGGFDLISAIIAVIPEAQALMLPKAV